MIPDHEKPPDLNLKLEPIIALEVNENVVTPTVKEVRRRGRPAKIEAPSKPKEKSTPKSTKRSNKKNASTTAKSSAAKEEACATVGKPSATKTNCPQCNRSIRDIDKHLTRCRKIQAEKSKCPKCYRTIKNTEKHMEICQADRIEKCPHCPRSMKPRRLRQHILQMHPVVTELDRERIYECYICGKITPNLPLLAGHIKFHPNHSLEPKFECKPCGIKFRAAHQLSRHNKVHRKCTICGQYSPSERFHSVHMVVEHVSNYVFECFMCHYQTYDYKRMYGHMKNMHMARKKPPPKKVKEKKFLCPQCGACFEEKISLKRHLMREDHQTGSGAQSKPFACKQCDRSFICNYRLKVHMRMHTGEKPIECTVCGNRFRTSDQMINHRAMVHFKKKRYKCDICGYECYMSNGMLKHKLTHEK